MHVLKNHDYLIESLKSISLSKNKKNNLNFLIATLQKISLL
jgi:hypothetical protein